jgi:hypothetical protein
MVTAKREVGTDSNGDRSTLALVANGSSGPWDVAVNEDGGEPAKLFVQIEGPITYLHFAIPSSQAIRTMRQYLQLRPAGDDRATTPTAPRATEPARIGTFGQASVILTWDDEFADRCFLVVGNSAKSTFRLTIAGAEVRHLSEALRQVEADVDGNAE